MVPARGESLLDFDLTAEEESGVEAFNFIELLEVLVVPVGKRTGGLFLGVSLYYGCGWVPPPRTATVKKKRKCTHVW